MLPGSDIAVWRGSVDAVIKQNKLMFFSVNTIPSLESVTTEPEVSKAEAIMGAQMRGPAGNTVHENARAELTVLPVEAAGVLDGRLAWKVQSSTAAPAASG